MRQPQWTIYEAAILLDGYLEANEKHLPKLHIVKRVSDELRQMAVNNGMVIDDVFRNENGISYQIQSMDSAYAGHKIYVPETKLFSEIVEIYRNNRKQYETILREARNMIVPSHSNRDSFLAWLDSTAPVKSRKWIDNNLLVVENYGNKAGIISGSLFNVTNVGILDSLFRGISKSKLFQIINKRTYKYIIQDQKAFVDFAHEAFGIADNLSVEQTASRVRVKLKDIGYPIWCFKCIDTNSLDAFLDNLAEISNAKAGDNVPVLAGQLGKMFVQVPTATSNLAELITEENGPKAMMEFLNSFENGAILSVGAAIGIPDVMNDVKRQIGSGEASWLWDKDTGVEELEKLLVDYRIIQKSNGIPSVTSSTSFFSCMQSWKEYTSFIKTPYSICKSRIPELSFFFECLKNIADECDLPHEKHAKFLNELDTKAAIIAALKERKMELFREEYSLYIHTLNSGSSQLLTTILKRS